MSIGRTAPAPRATLGLTLCTALLALYAAVAWAAVRRESPTYDEPYHALSAWVQLHRHDFRLDNEDPPLWQYWASLPNGPHAVSADFAGPLWREMATNISNQWAWTVATLYRTPGNDAARFVARCRAMMLVVAVGLGVTIAAWAWRLGGPVAAVVATALFACDPNFLAHGPLMKNDVALAVAWLAVAWSLWDAGRRVTVGAVARVAVLAAVPATVKYSGLLVAVLVPVVLGLRAVLPEPWPVLGRSVPSRRGRLAVTGGITVVAAVVGFVMLWAVYGFRFRSGPDPADRLDLSQLIDRAVQNERMADPARSRPGLAVRTVTFAGDHRLLPEPFLAGFLFTYGQSLIRPAYLLGDVSYRGWWYYFPVAMLIKTPLATLGAGVGVVVAAAIGIRHGGVEGRWAGLALAAPVAVYMASALSTHLNIGVRHVLPAYPPVFVAAGWATTAAVRRWGRPAAIGGGLLAAGLAAESAAAFPHFVPFDNAAALAWAGGDRLSLLGDSNLDWGQDLPLLADWRRHHRADPLYLSYFGLADPRAYGIDYVALPGGYRYDRPPRRFPDPRHPCWVAVSAMNLQGTQIDDDRLRPYYHRLAGRQPTEILGGSIYVYRYDPLAAMQNDR